jgi:hypothetical protein
MGHIVDEKHPSPKGVCYMCPSRVKMNMFEMFEIRMGGFSFRFSVVDNEFIK